MSLKNFELGMTERTSMTSMSILNCERMDLQDITSQVTVGLTSPTDVSLGNLQRGLAGVGELATVEFNVMGLSTYNAPGGWDNWGPVGAYQHVSIWAVYIQSTGQFGLCLSRNCSNGGPNIPGVSHALRIGWNLSNAAGNGFLYSLIKNQRRTYFVGENGDIPLIGLGLASKWTPLAPHNVVSPNAGALILRIRNFTPGTIIGVAPSQFWTGDPLAYVDYPGVATDLGTTVEVLGDAGWPVWWSTDPCGSISVIGFDDNF